MGWDVSISDKSAGEVIGFGNMVTRLYLTFMSDNNSLAGQQEIRAVSFIDREKILSPSQRILFQLMTNKLINNEPITEDDIIEAYFQAVSNNSSKI